MSEQTKVTPGRRIGEAAALVIVAAGIVYFVARSSRQNPGAPDSSARPGTIAKSVVADFEDARRNLLAFPDKPDVYTVTVPRDEWLQWNGTTVPGAAMASVFHFYNCVHCNKVSLIGEFCVADFEANDVLDALRAGKVTVVSVSPMVLDETPRQWNYRLLSIRCQSQRPQSETAALIATIRNALRYTGKARTGEK